MPRRDDQDSIACFKRLTEAKLRGVRCPEHRQSPRVSYHGTRLAELTISLRGCCPKLMELANRAVAASQ